MNNKKISSLSQEESRSWNHRGGTTIKLRSSIFSIKGIPAHLGKAVKNWN
jgi:hypothetical protein